MHIVMAATLIALNENDRRLLYGLEVIAQMAQMDLISEETANMMAKDFVAYAHKMNFP